MKESIKILLAAFLLRLVYYLAIMHFNPAGIWLDDSSEYWRLAENIVNHGEYSKSNGAPFSPEHFRTPLYPLFIALVQLVGGGGALLIFLQLLISAATCLMVYKLTLTATGNNKAALFAAAILAVDIPSIVFANFGLTETLFCFLLVTSAYFFFLHFKKDAGSQNLLYSGVFLGLSMLCRPVSLYIPLILFAGIIFYYRNALVKAAKPAAVFFSGLLLVMLPWFARNYVTFNKVFFSTVGEFMLAAWHAPNVYAQEHKMSTGNARHVLWTKWYYAYPGDPYLKPVHYSEYIAQKSKEIIIQNPEYLLKQQLIGVASLLLKPVRSHFDYQLGISKKKYETISSFNRLPGLSIVNRLLKSSSPFSVAMVLIQLVMLALVYTAFCVGIVKLYKEKKVFFLIVMGAIIFYLVNMIVPPITYSRFRVPVMPFIAVVSGVGMVYLMQFISFRRFKK